MRTLAEHVAEVQCIGGGEIVIDTKTEVVILVVQRLSRGECVKRTGIRFWKLVQQTERERIHARRIAWIRSRKLVVRIGIGAIAVPQENVEELAIGQAVLVIVAAKSSWIIGIEMTAHCCTQLDAISTTLRQRRHGALLCCALVIAVTFIKPEEESLVMLNRAANAAPKLVPLQRLL